MEPMTKKEKFKKFVSDHREVITKVTVYTTLVVGSIVIIVKAANSDIEDVRKRNAEAIDQHNSWVDEENQWLEEQEAEGKDIYLLHDWTYLLVPKNTETEWVGDRKPAQK